MPCTASARAGERRRPRRFGLARPSLPREDVEHRAGEDHRRRRGDRRQHRLAVEERRDDQEAREAHEQRAVARGARLEELDAHQHEEKRDARLAAEQIAVRRPDRTGHANRTRDQHPGRNAGRRRAGVLAVPMQQKQPQGDDRGAADRDPDRHRTKMRQLRGGDQRGEPDHLAGSKERVPRGRRARPGHAERRRHRRIHGAVAGQSASAVNASRR